MCVCVEEVREDWGLRCGGISLFCVLRLEGSV